MKRILIAVLAVLGIAGVAEANPRAAVASQTVIRQQNFRGAFGGQVSRTTVIQRNVAVAPAPVVNQFRFTQVSNAALANSSHHVNSFAFVRGASYSYQQSSALLLAAPSYTYQAPALSYVPAQQLTYAAPQLQATQITEEVDVPVTTYVKQLRTRTVYTAAPVQQTLQLAVPVYSAAPACGSCGTSAFIRGY
jgi:hypothetical protein